MCAARSDVVALLSVPRHYREQETVDHATSVRAGQPARPGAPGVEVPPLGGEERSLSFGALYHPWPVAARASLPEDLRAIPPDGHAAGVLAGRALLRGAWVAPANEALVGVLDLAPPIAPASWQHLQDGRVNTVRQESRGFLWLSADTLSDDRDLRELAVRRLLSLLRRVCLRYGPTFVFEPNDDGFRRRIRHNLERMLNEMLERGAFAGVTPGESYRVETLDPPNSPQTVEQGRLIVELKVAPSLPMRFLTIRLIHSGDLGISVEGA
jgi:phage tail sheath protein FI